MKNIKENYEKNIDLSYVEKEITVKTPIFVTPFGGEPFAIWAYKNTEGDSYYRAENTYRNVLTIDKVEGNEDIIFSSTWVLTDNPKIKELAKRYGKKIL